MTRPNPHIALIYHYDLARALAGEVVDWQAIPVNVDAGREGGDLCRAAADFAKRRDLFAMPAPKISPAVVEQMQEIIHPKSAVPVGPNPVVEQQAADPEPSTASTAVPGTAVNDDELPGMWSHSDFMGGDPDERSYAERNSAVDRDRLRARIKDLVESGDTSVEMELRRHWPEGVPTLKHDGHSDAQLQLILACVRRVEAEVGAGWHPDDSPEPHSRQAIDRALAAWRDSGRDEHELWFAVSLIATLRQLRNEDATIASIVAQFTIEQAERLYDAAQTK